MNHSRSIALALVALSVEVACGGDDASLDGGTDSGGGADGALDADARDGDAAPTDGSPPDTGVVPGCRTEFVTDDLARPPPTDGPYAYYPTAGTFGPDQSGFLARGESFVDPEFDTEITRFTDGFPSTGGNDIYARNGWWNADATLFIHRDGAGHHLLDGRTGEVLRSGVPGGAIAFEMSFDPVDPDVYYYYEGARLMAYGFSAGASSIVKDFGETLEALGGSVDYIDRTGRYFVVSFGGEIRVWDRESDTLYGNAISAATGAGWAGISPDASYLVLTGDPHRSFEIDHDARTIATTGTPFWSLCGDHGDLVSASDGRTYMVTFECHSEAAVYAVDVSLDVGEESPEMQRAAHRQLFDTDWPDSGHFSGVSTGPLADWAFVAVESGDDDFGALHDPWRPYQQEIVMANVVTGEVRRLAHHRSRGLDEGYYNQPRLSVSWDGAAVAWASNFGHDVVDYMDVYVARTCGD
jgi:hypothetical protein